MKIWGIMLCFYGIAACNGCAQNPLASDRVAEAQGEEVDDTIEEHAPAFASCAERELKPIPGKIQPATGTVLTRFVIGDAGRVIRANVEESDFSNPKLHACLIQKLNEIRFNVGEFTTPLEIKYPFVFTQNATRRF